MERDIKLSKKDLAMAQRFGGSDIDRWQDYKRPTEPFSCNRLDHFMRSLSHQPNHKKHLKEIK